MSLITKDPTLETQVLASNPAASAAYQHKPDSYFAGARLDFVRLLPRDPTASILEVGCGSGATGALALAGGRAGRYVGIELFEKAATEARAVLTEVITGDVEKIALPFGPTEFDALIMSEVLEHLVEPQATLEKLAACMRPGAMVLASSPNISHWRVVRELLMGRFNLADQGVFDRTHLRWFTPDTFAAMFTRAGFAVQVVAPVTPFAARTRMISRLTSGRYDHLFFEQIALVAIKR
jgi:2-polyprenyl-3-methyl-5-hydroxy-6-metoxy-1,4-benzoquinol methylase